MLLNADFDLCLLFPMSIMRTQRGGHSLMVASSLAQQKNHVLFCCHCVIYNADGWMGEGLLDLIWVGCPCLSASSHSAFTWTSQRNLHIVHICSSSWVPWHSQWQSTCKQSKSQTSGTYVSLLIINHQALFFFLLNIFLHLPTSLNFHCQHPSIALFWHAVNRIPHKKQLNLYKALCLFLCKSHIVRSKS